MIYFYLSKYRLINPKFNNKLPVYYMNWTWSVEYVKLDAGCRRRLHFLTHFKNILKTLEQKIIFQLASSHPDYYNYQTDFKLPKVIGPPTGA